VAAPRPQHDKGDKHKLERFLQPGRATVASLYGPIHFPPAPILLFKDNGPDTVPSLVATGSLLEVWRGARPALAGAWLTRGLGRVQVQPRRTIVKRIVLTGEPFKVHHRAATVRFMFFQPDDVRWFRPLQLRTKGGRIGHIRESLGTHGYMKCLFDGPLKQQDVVCMHLYKRAFPKWGSTVPLLGTPPRVLQQMPAGAAPRAAAHEDADD
jgi:pre-rRNA-processing protein TSR1